MINGLLSCWPKHENANALNNAVENWALERSMAIEFVDISSDMDSAPNPLPPSQMDAIPIPPDSEGIFWYHWPCLDFVDEFVDLPKKLGSLSKHQEYTLDGIKVKFPFNAYPSQLDMMTSVYSCSDLLKLTDFIDYQDVEQEWQVPCSSWKSNWFWQIHGHSVRCIGLARSWES